MFTFFPNCQNDNYLTLNTFMQMAIKFGISANLTKITEKNSLSSTKLWYINTLKASVRYIRTSISA